MPSYWRVADAPSFVDLLGRALARGVVEVILPLQGDWVFVSGYAGVDDDPAEALARRSAVPRRLEDSGHRWGPVSSLEDRIRETTREVVSLAESKQIDLLCSDHPGTFQGLGLRVMTSGELQAWLVAELAASESSPRSGA